MGYNSSHSPDASFVCSVEGFFAHNNLSSLIVDRAAPLTKGSARPPRVRKEVFG